MSGKTMLIHDSRLAGSPPSIARNTYLVSETTPTIGIIRWVGTYAQRQGGLDQLIIMCHGYHSGLSFDGLQLGTRGLTMRNIVHTSLWRPNIAKILIYACGAGDPGFIGPARSGRQFCRDLAGHSGAYIYASDQDQFYHISRGTINFGAWEGQVYRFSPDGTMIPTTLSPQAMPR